MKSRLKKEISEWAVLDQFKETLFAVLFDTCAKDIGTVFKIINRTGSTLITSFLFLIVVFFHLGYL